MPINLLNNVSKKREISRRIDQYPENQTYFYYQDSICGISTFWENPIHPVALYFSAYISPQLKPEDQCKVFEKILTPIETLAKKKRKENIICCDYAPQLTFNSLAKKHYFKLIRTTIEPTLDLNLLSKKNTVLDNGYQILTLEELEKNFSLLNELTQICFNDYKINHRVNPVAELSCSQWSSLIYKDQLKNAPLLLVYNNKILAYCFLFEDETDILTVGWMGSKQNKALTELQNVQLNWAKDYFIKLTGEFDSTDLLSMKFYESLPFEPCSIYETYLKRIDNLKY